MLSVGQLTEDAALNGALLRMDWARHRRFDLVLAVLCKTNEMKLLNLIVKIYERWQDRRRFGKLEPLDHYCVRRVLENGDEIKYMMRYDPRTTKRGQPPTETSE